MTSGASHSITPRALIAGFILVHLIMVVLAGPRVGVSKAADRPWRFWLDRYPEVSAYRRSPRAPVTGRSD